MKALPKSLDPDAGPVVLPRLREARDAPAPAPDHFFTVHQGDARRLELLLSRYSSLRKPLLTSTITSPPYGALKELWPSWANWFWSAK